RHTRSKRDWSSDVCSSDLAEHQLAGFGPGSSAVYFIEEPLDLRSGEVRVEEQSSPCAEERFQPLGSELLAERRRAPVLPDYRVGDRASVAVPDDRRLALVRDSNGGQVLRGCLCLLQRFLRSLQLRLPDLFRVVLDPARLR